MIIEREIDAAELYEQTRCSLLELVRSLTTEQQATTVPATPAWSVLDVVAHVVGINADLRVGSFGPGDQNAWTAAQVECRRGRSIDELAAEWDDEAPAFEAGLRAFGYAMGSHFLGDLLQHLSDVRHALDRPRIPDDDTLLVALDFYLDSFDGGLRDAEVGSVTLHVGGAEWTLGNGPVVATWTVDRYECFRSLGGRRDETQVRAQAWTGDVDSIVPLVSRYGMPQEGIVER